MSDTTLLAYLPSPPQGVWHLGPLPIRAYALCIIIGIIVAVWWGDRRWRARGGQPGDVLDVALWAVPFGLIGGRIYHVATDWYRYFGDNGKGLSGAIAIWDGGLGIWGAVLFGALGAWIGCRFKGIKLPSFGDAIAPAILLAQAIGRLGNYFNQELFGGPTTLPWGLEIYQRVDADGYVGCTSLANDQCYLMEGTSNGVVLGVVHPTFLYELLWNVLVVILLVIVDRQFRIGHGRLFALYVAGYSVGRFGVELLRTDPATHVLGLRINLFTAAVVFLCAALYFVMAPKGRETGLSMYWPRRAEELAAQGEVGYVPPGIVEAGYVEPLTDAPGAPETGADETVVTEAAATEAAATAVAATRVADEAPEAADDSRWAAAAPAGEPPVPTGLDEADVLTEGAPDPGIDEPATGEQSTEEVAVEGQVIEDQVVDEPVGEQPAPAAPVEVLTIAELQGQTAAAASAPAAPDTAGDAAPDTAGDAAEAQIAELEGAEPEGTEPETGEPETGESETVEPEPEPEAAEPETVESETVEPEIAEPETVVSATVTTVPDPDVPADAGGIEIRQVQLADSETSMVIVESATADVAEIASADDTEVRGEGSAPSD